MSDIEMSDLEKKIRGMSALSEDEKLKFDVDMLYGNAQQLLVWIIQGQEALVDAKKRLQDQIDELRSIVDNKKLS